MHGLTAHAILICTGVALALGGCSPGADAKSNVAGRPISFPITYADAKTPGVMLFINEKEGLIALGNRDPGDWRLGGPPPPWLIERCDAGKFACLNGVAAFHPIVVGDMNVDHREVFSNLGIAVVRRNTQVCDTFEATPLNETRKPWKQDVVFCKGLGVVQISLIEDGIETARLDLKSAQGLLSPDGFMRVDMVEPRSGRSGRSTPPQ